jgi:hypothetical protein
MTGSKKDAGVSETPDSLLTDGAAELVESQLDGVVGGTTVIQATQDVTNNQQKGAQKSAEAADALIRG